MYLDKWIWGNREIDGKTIEDITNYISEINQEIEKMHDAQERRERYTAYMKSRIGTKEREVARQEYLDHVGIPEDYRTKKEIDI